MNRHMLMVLMEIEQGVFHACCIDYARQTSLKALVEKGLINLVGDEYFLTADGEHVVNASLHSAEDICG